MSDSVAHHAISGVVARLVTPFDADGCIDVRVLRRLLDRMIGAGVDAVTPLGDSGESIYLDRTEWRHAAAACLEQVAGRVPTILDVSDITTAGTIERARFAEKLGAAAILIRPLSCGRLSENELRQHFATVAEFVSAPIAIGNDPAATGIDMTTEFLVDLVTGIDSITMIVEFSGCVQRMNCITDLIGGSISLFNGSDLHVPQAFHDSAGGWYTAAACLVPEQVVRLWRLLNCEQDIAAAVLFDQLAPLFATVAGHGLPAILKSGLRFLGINAGDPRLPQLPLDIHIGVELAELISAVRATTRFAPDLRMPTHPGPRSGAITATSVCSRSLRR
ncbi:dihydrodipicolinate synthase family protein [Nocardia sp. NBC_00881]|uniref:dihydrodipicolinate synthase family protein n=1 Tax=Nocardia sp. NBC_00881 TaxID=2975995 RepID=UPI003865F871|nr:dihydrodipicolinate synthase family protein [Nocardia sp. NBC_00881]